MRVNVAGTITLAGKWEIGIKSGRTEKWIKSVLRGGGGGFDSYDRTPFCLNGHYFSCDLVLNLSIKLLQWVIWHCKIQCNTQSLSFRRLSILNLVDDRNLIPHSPDPKLGPCKSFTPLYSAVYYSKIICHEFFLLHWWNRKTLIFKTIEKIFLQGHIYSFSIFRQR